MKVDDLRNRLGQRRRQPEPELDPGVRRFQSDRGLVNDGVVGPRTFAYLARVPSSA
jgi:murein L,D-transpeptidase YcbB/YkuD